MLRKLSASVLAISIIFLGSPSPSFGIVGDPASSGDPSIIQDVTQGSVEEIQQSQSDLENFVNNLTIAQETEGIVTEPSKVSAVPVSFVAAEQGAPEVGGSAIQDTQIPAEMIAATQSGSQEPVAVPVVVPPAAAIVEPAVPAAQEGKIGDGLVPVALIQPGPEVGGAELDADLDRIAELFRNVGTVDPNAPVFPGVNSTEANVANNYLNGLWASLGGPSGLMEPIVRLLENPGWATEAQKNRIRALFETNFLAMLRRATNLPAADRVYIATDKLGVMLFCYIKAGLSNNPTTLLALYRELRINQDGLLARLRVAADAAVVAPQFQTPYEDLMRPFDGNIFSIVVMLNRVEAELVPLLGRGMVLTAEQQRAARDEIMNAASDRAIALVRLTFAAHRIGQIGMGERSLSNLSNVAGPVGTLYKSWADVMRAVVNLVTAGEEATAPARAVYAKVIIVSPWITELISLLYPDVDGGNSWEGLSAAKQVVDEMPMMQILSLHLLTEAQQTRLLEEYRRAFQVLRLRLIGVAQYLNLTNAGRISSVVDAVDSIVRATRTLALSGATLTPEEWSVIYTEVGRCIRLAAGRAAGMEAGFTRVASVESLARSTRVFALAMIEMLRQPPFAGQLDQLSLMAHTLLILELFPPILGRLRSIAAAPRVGESGEAMRQAISEHGGRGLESLWDYIEELLRPIQ